MAERKRKYCKLTCDKCGWWVVTRGTKKNNEFIERIERLGHKVHRDLPDCKGNLQRLYYWQVPCKHG